MEHRDRLLKLAADNSGAKQKVTLCTCNSTGMLLNNVPVTD